MADFNNQKEIKEYAKYHKELSISRVDQKKFEQITELATNNKLAKDLLNEVNKENFELDHWIDLWLKNKPTNTINTSKRALDKFIAYIDQMNIHVLDIKAAEVDQFINYLNDSSYNNNSKRVHISYISSFYSSLVRWNKIPHNYFKGCRLPKKTESESLDVPNEAEVKAILELANDKYKTIFEFIITTGCRVGFLPTMKIGQKGYIKGTSKGKEIDYTIDPELATRLRKIGKLPSKRAIQKYMSRITHFTPHSLRHYFAVKDYSEHKDIYRLSRLLKHASYQVTETYLKSIKVI